MITWENYEEYMMLHADGELTRAEEQALMSFVYEHPELANELAAYSMSKMIPDTTQVYADKKSLLKKEPVRVIAFPNWQRYAVAAGVVILLSVAGLRFFGGEDEAAVAAVDRGSFTTQPTHMASGSVQDDKKDVAAIVSPQSIAPAPTPKRTRVKQTTTKQNTKYTKPEPTAVAVEAIDHLPAEYVGMINNDRKIFSPGAVTNIPPVAIQIEEPQKKSFLDKLPIDDTKKEGMENVAAAVASGYDKVKAIRQSINETSITVRVEKRKLILSF